MLTRVRAVSVLRSSWSRFCSTTTTISPEDQEIIDTLLKRSYETRETVSEWKVKAMAATFHRPLDSFLADEYDNILLPQGWHQLFGVPTVYTSDLSPDGYEPDFSPPEPYVSRLWGGATVQWETVPGGSKPIGINIGDHLQRKQFIANAKVKTGEKSGKMLILTLRNEYYRVSDQLKLLTDDVNLIYRTQALSVSPSSAAEEISHKKHVSNLKIRLNSVGDSTSWYQNLVGNSVLLFRYSALTFNAHMIHYDQHYSQNEGFNNTIVHGPLQAQLLLDLIQRVFPATPLHRFEYKALSPLLNQVPFTVELTRHKDSPTLDLTVTDQLHHNVTLKGTAVLSKE